MNNILKNFLICTRKHSVNPFVEYTPMNHQGDLSNLNQCIDQPIASIRPIGRIITCTLLSSVCLSLLHPVSTLAMDPKMEVETTKKFVSEIEMVIGTDQEAVAGGDAEKAVVSTGINGQQVSPSSSSSLKRDRASFSTASENSQIANVELKRQQAQAKYEEALEQGNQPVVVLWQEITAQYQEQANYYQKSTEAIANGTREWEWDQRAENINSITLSLKFAIEAVEKTAIATTPSNQQLAVLCQKITTQHQEAGEYYRKYSEARARGNQNEVNQWYKAAQNINSSISCLTLAVEALEKDAIASAQNNLPLTTLWQEIITQYQEVAKCYQQSAKAIATGNTEEERSWNAKAGVIHYNISRLKSASEIVQEATKKAAEYYQKATEAVTVGNADEEWQWKKAAQEVESSESCLKLAAEAFEKAAIATTQNNLPVATLWQKIAPQYQEEAEYHRKSSEAVATGNAEEMRKVRNILNKYGCDFSSMYLSNQKSEAVKSLRDMGRFCNMAEQLHRSIYYLKSAIEALEKATIATTKGTQAVAAAWQEVARARQKIAELYQNTIKGIEEGDDQDIGWIRAFEEEFNNAEGDEKYYKEQVHRLEKETATAVAEEAK